MIVKHISCVKWNAAVFIQPFDLSKQSSNYTKSEEFQARNILLFLALALYKKHHGLKRDCFWQVITLQHKLIKS